MHTGLISVLIPAKNEIFLTKTIQDLLTKARGDIEIIAVLDGYWINPQDYISDPRVNYLHFGTSVGMRQAINKAAQLAKGEFMLKSDAHCMFDEGWDVKLKEGINDYIQKLGQDYLISNQPENYDNWIVIPRRKRLDAEKWEIQDVGKPDVDYEYISSPADAGVKGSIWTDRIIERLNKPEYMIDENMSFQGSCYFCTINHYLNRLGGMQEEGYGSFVREAQEIGLKTWLGGGKVFTNKKTWYAHLHKGTKYGRMYFLNKREMEAGNEYCDRFWFENKWDKAVHDLAWFIERFSPVPTWTPELINQVRKHG